MKSFCFFLAKKRVHTSKGQGQYVINPVRASALFLDVMLAFKIVESDVMTFVLCRTESTDGEKKPSRKMKQKSDDELKSMAMSLVKQLKEMNVQSCLNGMPFPRTLNT